MNIISTGIIVLLFSANFVYGHGDDDPLLSRIMLDQIEAREDDKAALEIDAWVGKDLHKAWFKVDWVSEDGEIETAELQALYSRAISAYWDLQLGVRHDFELDYDEAENWAVIGLQGLAPYFFDVDAALYVGDGGNTALRFEAEYELLITQRWVLIPEIELNLYDQNHDQRGIGSGLSEAEFGLRLAYYFRREVAPYVGYYREQAFGNSHDYAEQAGVEPHQSTWVAGFKLWF
jgi:copper resistance protein B